MTVCLAQTILFHTYGKVLCPTASLTIDLFHEIVPANIPDLIGGVIIPVILSFIHINQQWIATSRFTSVITFSNGIPIRNIQNRLLSLRHRRTICYTTVVLLNIGTHIFTATIQQFIHYITY